MGDLAGDDCFTVRMIGAVSTRCTPGSVAALAVRNS
jgi:hypothetical protein